MNLGDTINVGPLQWQYLKVNGKAANKLYQVAKSSNLDIFVSLNGAATENNYHYAYLNSSISRPNIYIPLVDDVYISLRNPGA